MESSSRIWYLSLVSYTILYAIDDADYADYDEEEGEDVDEISHLFQGAILRMMSDHISLFSCSCLHALTGPIMALHSALVRTLTS